MVLSLIIVSVIAIYSLEVAIFPIQRVLDAPFG